MPVTGTKEHTRGESCCQFISGDEYHRHPAYSKTRLSCFAESRRLYQAIHVDGSITPKSSDAKDLGSFAHAAILEPDRLEGEFIRIPPEVLTKDGKRAGNAWKQFAAEHADQTLLKERDWDTVETIVKSVQQSDIARLLYAGGTFTEGSWFYVDHETKLQCKFRPDVLKETDDCVYVFDPKVTSLGVSPGQFRHQIKKFRYWLSVAHTTAGVQSEFKKPCRYLFVAVSVEPPHTCTVHEMTEATVEEAMARRAEILAGLRACIDVGDWSEPWEYEVNNQSLTREEMW